MTITARRIGVGILVLFVALVATVIARMTSGSAAAAPPKPSFVTHANVAVHLKGGATKSYANVKSVRTYAAGHKLVVTTESGAIHRFGKRFRSYTTTYVERSVASIAPAPSGTPTSSPTGLPSGLPTISPTGLPSLPSGLPSLPLPTGLPTLPTGLPTLSLASTS
jgi:hypothetical protein